MLENLSTKRELHLHGRYGLATYLRASASFGSRRHSRAPSRPQAPQAARDGGWLEPVERASLWRSTLSEPYRRNQRLKNSLQTRFQPRHPQGAAVRARRHPASIAISVPLRSGQRVSPAALESPRTRLPTIKWDCVGVEIKVAGVGSLPSCHLAMIWAQPSWRLVNDRIGIGIPTDGTSTVRTSSGVQYRGTTLPAGKEQEPTVLSRVWLTCHPGGKEDRGGSCTVTRLYRHLRSAGEGGQSCCCN